jgi:hypothetical protein
MHVDVDHLGRHREPQEHDRLPAGETADVPHTEIIYGDELGIERWARYSFQYTPFELSCAIKPHIMRRLLDMGYQEVVYLDADMAVYGPLVEVFESLARHSIVLTPHLLEALPDDGKRPHERAFLVSGTFNAGFLALRADLFRIRLQRGQLIFKDHLAVIEQPPD